MARTKRVYLNLKPANPNYADNVQDVTVTLRGDQPSGEYGSSQFWDVIHEKAEKSLSMFDNHSEQLQAANPQAGQTYRLRLQGQGKNAQLYVEPVVKQESVTQGVTSAPQPRLDVSYEDYLQAFIAHLDSVQTQMPNADASTVAILASGSWLAAQLAGVQLPFRTGTTETPEVPGSPESSHSGYQSFVAAALKNVGAHPSQYTALLTLVFEQPVSLVEITEAQAKHLAGITNNGKQLDVLKGYFDQLKAGEFPPDPEEEMPWG